MSDDKDQRTEEATPRRRQKAREEGQVAKSQDMSAAATFVGGMIALGFTGTSAAATFAQHTVMVLGRLDTLAPMSLFGTSADVLSAMALPVALSAAIMALVAGFGQVGWNPTIKPLTPDMKKFNIIK